MNVTKKCTEDGSNLSPRKKKSTKDIFGGHPYGIVTSIDPEYVSFADYYHIIYGPEMEERGIYWELEGSEPHEFHGSPFLIKFNPKYKWPKRPQQDSRTPECEVV